MKHALVTFPSWLKEDDSLGVKFVYVDHGIYDRGGKRDNQAEAAEIVNLISEHIARGDTESLGVVAFSVAQAEAIDNALEEYRRQRPELEYFFDKTRAENFFVRNLESVQGDERDVLIFSIGYGRDRFGKLTMHFGPINQPGGERRLNVAVTRARKKVIVVSSIRASDLDMSGVTAPGVRALYRYLDYAERGPDTLTVDVGGGDFESPLESAVASAIRELGFEVVPQVGCSGFRIDLGVIDPAKPGRYLLGVECDGAMYHSAATARDRDRLRQQTLEKLGWNIHRIWSPDWVSRRSIEIDRLKTAIEHAQTELDNRIQQPMPAPCGTADPLIIERNPPQQQEWTSPTWVDVYKVSQPKFKGNTKVVSRQDFSALILDVVRIEGPVHTDIVARRVSRGLGWERTGARLFRALDFAYDLLKSSKQVTLEKGFISLNDADCKLSVRKPDYREPESRRTVEQIAEAELGLAMNNLVADALSIPRDILLTSVARIFGFDRKGNHIQHRLEKVLRELIKKGQLIEAEGRISTLPT